MALQLLYHVDDGADGGHEHNANSVIEGRTAFWIGESPDIRQFITVTLPEHLQPNDSVDNAVAHLRANYAELPENPLKDIREYLPEEVESLPHQGRDVLQRLLEFDGHKRLHSVRALQRIAMYKDFKIEAQYIKKIRPLDIIAADNITLYNDDNQSEQYGIDVDKAFKNF